MTDLFADHVPLGEQIAEVEREIALRKRVYPNRIATGRMTQHHADRHLAVMEAVLKTLSSIRG
jgi:hypothetical protein